jgi:hypothetical protein
LHNAVIGLIDTVITFGETDTGTVASGDPRSAFNASVFGRVREEDGGARDLVANRYRPAPIGSDFDRLRCARSQREKT